MKEACIEKIQEVVAGFQSVGPSSNSRSLFFAFSFYPLCPPPDPHIVSLYLITSPYVSLSVSSLFVALDLQW